jgi:hypothetical protein
LPAWFFPFGFNLRAGLLCRIQDVQ